MTGRTARLQLLLGGALLAGGLVAVAAGVLPARDAASLGARVAPVLGFVAAITVVAAIAAASGVFDRVAEAAARVADGRTALLWLLVAAVAVASTVFLSIDTTAVLLTPAVVVLARRIGVSPVPFALLTVWVANTGSLLLPVSNLTNLLAAARPPLADGFATRTWLPAAVAVAVPLVVLSVASRRAIASRFVLVRAARTDDPVLLRATAVVLAGLLPALALGEPLLRIPVWLPAAVAAALLLVVAVVRAPGVLTVRMLPIPLVVLVCGLFLAVAIADRMGLSQVLAGAAGRGSDLPSLLRLAGAGAVAANAVDNLPAYLALEPVAHTADRLIALLVGVNAGPLVTPWASLATLLWHERLAATEVRVPWSRFVALGLVAAPLTVLAATLVVPLA